VIYFYASQPHYWRHMAPIADRFEAQSFTRIRQVPDDDTPVVIAGMMDLDGLGLQHPVALVEHGAGQTYQGLEHSSWAGGTGRDRVGLVLVPRQELADAHLQRYPDSAAAVVGCPALDRHVGQPRAGGTVAFTFHPDWTPSNRIPELRSAFPHYKKYLPDVVGQLQANGFHVVGHHHPRWLGLERFWRRLGLPTESDWDALLPRLSCVVVDNSSVGWEALAVGVGCVWLNAPWYRRDVEHGLRFWAGAERFGSLCDDPCGIPTAVGREAEQASRGAVQGAMRVVYTYDDNRSAERAADAIRAWLPGSG
jgi:hypothetical protein